jgi:signal transduction histidine kinase
MGKEKGQEALSAEPGKPEGAEGARASYSIVPCGSGERLLFAMSLILFIIAAACRIQDAAGAAPFFISGAALAAAALCQCANRARLKQYVASLEAATSKCVLEEHARAEAALTESHEKILRYHSLISHGLRIPISIIMGYADILTGKMVTDAGARDEYLHKMCEKAAYMNELLTYSLLEMQNREEKRSPVRKPFELLSLLRGILDAVREMAVKNGVAIQLVSDQDELFVQGNALTLSKAFYNIIENAFKYMGRPGSLNITVALLEDGEVFIAFKDDGLGMDEDSTEHIFEVRYQGQNRESGEGLGLWIVKTEVESHGGRVYAKSSKGAGMGIYIVLPVE